MDGHHLATGTFSLVVEQLPKHPQSRIVCREGEVSIVRHKRQREVFDGDPSKGIYQFTRRDSRR